MAWLRNRRQARRDALRAALLAALTTTGQPPMELARRMGLPHAASLYAPLARMERTGVVESEWESPDPADYPRRRLYRLAGTS